VKHDRQWDCGKFKETVWEGNVQSRNATVETIQWRISGKRRR
jgi:hypothetical protein